MAYAAGDYDPVPCTVYKPVIQVINGEPINQTPETLGRFFLRFPYMARTGSEQEVAAQRISHGQIVIRMRRSPKTMTIVPNMWFTHAGLTYHVVKQNKIMDRDELEWLCENRENSTTTVTP